MEQEQVEHVFCNAAREEFGTEEEFWFSAVSLKDAVHEHVGMWMSEYRKMSAVEVEDSARRWTVQIKSMK